MLPQKDYAANVWAVMGRFGQPGFRDELNDVRTHRLSNILTMDNLLHTSFDQLNLWLEAVPVNWKF